MNEWIEVVQTVGDEFCRRWTITLLHFLWQGLAIGVIVTATAWLLRQRSARSRYIVYAMAMSSLPVCAVVTLSMVTVKPLAIARLEANMLRVPDRQSQPEVMFPLVRTSQRRDAESRVYFVERQSTSGSAETGLVLLPQSSGPRTVVGIDEASAVPRDERVFSHVAMLVVAAYFVAVAILLIRVLVGVWGGHRLRARATFVTDAKLLRLVANQSRVVGLKFVPMLAYCERVAVPTVIGVLRPVILLPAAVVTGLAPDQLAAIVCHELAHIRRFDLLVNLLQRLIEFLLFFHPVVWYISRRMSAEREACCDDLVVASGCPRLDYAGALLRLAEMCVSTRSQQTALAALGNNKSQLERRIMRLIDGTTQPAVRLTRLGLSVAILLVATTAGAPFAVKSWADRLRDPLATPQSNSTSVGSTPANINTNTTVTQCISFISSLCNPMWLRDLSGR